MSGPCTTAKLEESAFPRVGITLEANHGWSAVDLTSLLPEWISAHEYREAIFEQPEHFSANDELETLAAERVRQACCHEEADVSSVVAVIGLASLFDFMRVSRLIERVEDNVRGRLLVFFPGEYAGNVYRFMDARDGFNYMAVPITSTESRRSGKINFRYRTGLPNGLARSPLLPDEQQKLGHIMTSVTYPERSRGVLLRRKQGGLAIWSPIAPASLVSTL